MQIELGPRVSQVPGLVAAFEAIPPSRGDMRALVRLIGLRRHLSRTLVVIILKGREEGVGDVAVVPG